MVRISKSPAHFLNESSTVMSQYKSAGYLLKKNPVLGEMTGWIDNLCFNATF